MNNLMVKLSEIRRYDVNSRSAIDFKVDDVNNFKDEIWDFNYLNTNKRSKKLYRINFLNIPNCFLYYCKVMSIREYKVVKNRITTVKSLIDRIKTICIRLYDKGIFDVRLINLEIIKEYVESLEKNNQPSVVAKAAIDLIKLLNTIHETDEIDFIEIKEYLSQIATEYSKIKTISAVNDYIPDKFLDQIIYLAFKDLDNNKLKYEDRIVAGLVIIMASTGMRAEELSLLETGKGSHIEVGDKKANFIEFLTFKSNKGNKTEMKAKCFITNDATQAYKKCEELVSKLIDNLSYNSKSKLLYFIYSGEYVDKKKCLPIKYRKILQELTESKIDELIKECKKYIFIAKNGMMRQGTGQLRDNFQKFFIRHRNDINLSILSDSEKEQIRYLQIKAKSRYERIFSKEEKKTLSFDECRELNIPYVGLHQFRVTVCTKLFRQGVHIDYIMKHMNHLSEDMTAYYYKSDRLANRLDECIEIFNNMKDENGYIETDENKYDDQVIRSEFSNDLFRENVEKINRFLQKNNLNINRDINKIMGMYLKSNDTISENEFGMCVRSVINGICEKRKYFSSMGDNYFIGIQLDSYDYLSSHYERFIQKKNVVEHNGNIAKKDKRYINEYQREKKALTYYVEKTLMKEIDLLESDLNYFGVEFIMSKNKGLKNIINNLENIKGELENWINR